MDLSAVASSPLANTAPAVTAVAAVVAVTAATDSVDTGCPKEAVSPTTTATSWEPATIWEAAEEAEAVEAVGRPCKALPSEAATTAASAI